MKKLITAIGITSALLFLQSCDNQEEELNIIENETSIHPEHVYGPAVTIKDNEESGLANRNTDNISTNWKRISSDDLRTFEDEHGRKSFTNTDALKNRFTFILNRGSRRPNNVSINGSKFGFGSNPNGRFNWNADFRASGKKTKNSNSTYTAWKRIQDIPARWDRNRSKKGRWMELQGEWRVETTNETNWSVKNSFSHSFSLEISVPDTFKATNTFTVGLDRTKGGSESRKITDVLRGGRIWVPAGKAVVWEAQERHKTNKSTWSIPLEFRGKIGADYGTQKHHGSHYWSVPAKNFFYDYTERDRKYVVNVSEDNSKQIRVHAYIE